MKDKKHRATTDHEVLEALASYRTFLVTSHVRPEGDSVGSVLGMCALLQTLGKQAFAVCQDPFPARFQFLSDSTQWARAAECPPRSYDAFVVLDAPTLERIGTVKDLVGSKTAIFNIDHHVSNTFFGTHNLVDPKAAATGEIVYGLFKAAHLPIDARAAASLYVSLTTDTGSFRYGNTTSHSHRVAAELIDTGFPLEALNETLAETFTPARLKLFGRLLARVEITHAGKTAWVSVTSRDFQETGSSPEDTEGVIDFLRYLKGVRVAFILTEAEGEVLVSLRAKADADVNRIAQQFGGGGHKKAAGCQIRGTLEEARDKMLKACLI